VLVVTGRRKWCATVLAESLYYLSESQRRCACGNEVAESVVLPVTRGKRYATVAKRCAAASLVLPGTESQNASCSKR
jgi:hypothetical protein